MLLDYDLTIFSALGKAEGKGKGRGKGKGEEEAVVLGDCAACGQAGGILAVCRDEGCGVATHITCLARRSLLDEEQNSEGGQGRGKGEGQGQGQILPTTAHCPRCAGAMKWSDVAGGVTGRIRGKSGNAQMVGGEKGGKGGKEQMVGGGSVAGSIVENASASGSGLESGSESEADSWAGVVELE